MIAQLTGYDKLPDKPFAIKGAFHGTPEKLHNPRISRSPSANPTSRARSRVDIPRQTFRSRQKSRRSTWSRRVGASPALARRTPGPCGPTSNRAPQSRKPAWFSPKTPIRFRLAAACRRCDVDITHRPPSTLPVKRFHDIRLQGAFGRRPARRPPHRDGRRSREGNRFRNSWCSNRVGDSYRRGAGIWTSTAIRSRPAG